MFINDQFNNLVNELEQRNYEVRRSPRTCSYALSIYDCRDEERPGGVDEVVEKLLSRYSCQGRWNGLQTALLVTSAR